MVLKQAAFAHPKLSAYCYVAYWTWWFQLLHASWTGRTVVLLLIFFKNHFHTERLSSCRPYEKYKHGLAVFKIDKFSWDTVCFYNVALRIEHLVSLDLTTWVSIFKTCFNVTRKRLVKCYSAVYNSSRSFRGGKLIISRIKMIFFFKKNKS